MRKMVEENKVYKIEEDKEEEVIKVFSYFFNVCIINVLN